MEIPEYVIQILKSNAESHWLNTIRIKRKKKKQTEPNRIKADAARRSKIMFSNLK